MFVKTDQKSKSVSSNLEDLFDPKPYTLDPETHSAPSTHTTWDPNPNLQTQISKPKSPNPNPKSLPNPKSQNPSPKSKEFQTAHLCGKVNVKAREQVDHNLIFPVLCQKVNKLVHLLPRLAQHIQVAQRRWCALLPLVRAVLRHGNLPGISQAGPRKCGYFIVHRGGE